MWVADPLDGTINYATGSPLCGVMLGLLEDGVPVLGVIDLPFLGVRDRHRRGRRRGRRFDEAIVGVGDAFHRGGPRMDAFLDLGSEIHRRALRFRCVGAASVLWTWLAGGQIQGMLLAHNNPYDVVAGHAIARAAGAVVTDYAGAPLTLDSTGAMAAVPGVHGDARSRWRRDLAAGRHLLRRQLEARGRRRARPSGRARVVGQRLGLDDARSPSSASLPGRPNSCTCGSRSASSTSSGAIRTIRLVVAHDAAGHVAADHPADAAEHLALDDARAVVDQLADARGELLVVGHRSSAALDDEPSAGLRAGGDDRRARPGAARSRNVARACRCARRAGPSRSSSRRGASSGATPPMTTTRGRRARASAQRRRIASVSSSGQSLSTLRSR